MDPFGLNPESVVARVRRSGDVAPMLSHSHSLLLGAVGLCVASLVVFGTVAFGERWMYQSLGLTGAYLTWTLLFIVIGGALLSPLLIGPGLGRFYALFSVAFLLYAVGWIGAYFTVGGLAGEWLGSLAGTLLMGLTFCWAFGSFARLLTVVLILFAGNSLGYFAGSFLNSSFGGSTGMLLWGLCFGLGLGLALGRVLYDEQNRLRELLRDPFATTA